MSVQVSALYNVGGDRDGVLNRGGLKSSDSAWANSWASATPKWTQDYNTPSYASAAAVDILGTEEVEAASAPSGKRRSGKGKGGKSGGGGSGGGGGGGGRGGGGGGGSGGGSGGVGGGGGGSGGSYGGGGCGRGSGGGGTGGGPGGDVMRGGSGGGQRQQQQRPRKTPMPQSGVDIFALDSDAILAAMYALTVSTEGDCYVCEPPDPGIEAAALDASVSTIPSSAPVEALHTFMLDLNASRCFFRDSTTLTPLPAPVPARLADPLGGPVLARSTIVLPCLAISSGSLRGLHLPSFSTNLVSTAALQDAMVTTTTTGDLRVAICMCTRTGRHLATITRRSWLILYTLTTEPPQIVASGQVSAPSQVTAPSLCRLLSHQTLLWHHRLGHPSLSCLSGMHSRLLVSGLPRSLPPLQPSPAPPCLPCAEGRQHAAPHSSSFPPTTAPLQTLHMDVWGPARVSGQSNERYFLLVVDDFTRYTTVFPLRSKGQVPDVLIPWIRAVCLQPHERFRKNLPILRLHSDRGGEFSSDLLRDFCRGEGILQSFTLLASLQQNEIDERRIGSIIEVARTSMIHAAAPHFLWPFAVRYATHQLNLWPRVSLPETSPTLRWMGKVGDASDPSAIAEPGGAEQEGAELEGNEPEGAEPGGAKSEGAESGGAEPSGIASTGGPAGASPRQSRGREPLSPRQPREWFSWRTRLRSGAVGAGGPAAGGTGARGAGASSPGGAGVTAGARVPRGAGAADPGGARSRGTEAARAVGVGGAGAGDPRAGGAGARGAGAGGTGVAGAAGPGGACTRGTRAAGAGGVGGAGVGDPGVGGTGARNPGDGGAGAGGVGATLRFAFGLFSVCVHGGAGAGGAGARSTEAGGTRARGAGVGARGAGAGGIGAGAGGIGAGGAGAGDPGAGGAGARGAGAGGIGAGGTVQRRPFFVLPPSSSLPPPHSVLHQVLSLPSSIGLTPPLLCPPPHQSQPQSQPDSSLPAPSPYAEQTESLTERRTHILALRPSSVPLRVPLPSPPASSLANGPDPESDFVRAVSPTVTRLLATVVTNPLFESAAASAVVAKLVDFAAACRLYCATSLLTESESDCPPSVGGECALTTDVLEDNIPTQRSYAEAITSPYSSQWQTTMVAEMASWKSTGTYVDAVPPHGANIVDGMWIFRVKGPPGSPPVFKARYVARGFRQPLEEIWLRRPCGFTGLFPAGTLWSLRPPVYGLRQASHEWHDTLRVTLAALGFPPSTADPSLLLRINTLLPPFYILVYIDDLVFATADTEALALVKSELQKRHTCIDLGELRSYLGLQITRDRARHTITLTRSVEPSGPYLELVGCLMYVMTCTRLDLAYPLSILARYVAPGRHRPEHWEAAKRVLRYWCSTSGMGLGLEGRGPVVLTRHADASWVDDLATQRSSHGYTFSLGSGSVSWRSTRSSSVLSSSYEAEIYAGAMAGHELRWLTYLLTDQGEQPRSPPVLYGDNKAMIALGQEHRVEHRTKHIALRYYLARELQQRGHLRLAYVATRANTAG
ncbi:unnamed protein product [Closterium sp. NIES-53]